ncbi:Aste57867_13971 [Aphanomyces stellatus]|uniref:Aste57867_13971 protein n=1 Tax=Aphanomyces stellatus TaxID=120398 RepID=A0A485L0F2_9STRA|nr:hypothetical protein As57867_013920 [Aphanomyces stellatus]VFT90801.1 Aste57867_13971 [Aphanomyces stellatus]
MFGFFVVWNVVSVFLSSSSKDKNNATNADGNNADKWPSAPSEKWPSAPTDVTPVPITTAVNLTNETLINATLSIKKNSFKMPPFPSEAPKVPIPTAATCGITRKAKSAKETAYLTVDDGPSPSGRLFLLRALDQINQRPNAPKAYVTFMESGYNFCGYDTVSMTNLKCDPKVYEPALENQVWTIKAGHVIAAHSDTHFYDASSGFCNYVKMNKATVIEEKYKKCGTDQAADIVRGASRITEALTNESLWDTDAERALQERAIKTLWQYARLPCTNMWKVNGFETVFGLRREDGGVEGDARKATGVKLFGGKMDCKNDTKPWNVIGWDAEWRVDAKTVYDSQKEKCRVVQDIVNQFDNKWKVMNAHQDQVVLLTHDYFFADPPKAAMFRDVIVELQFLGYTIGTIDNYPL